MLQQIGRSDVQRLAGAGAQIVEVLGSAEYRRRHLPGAIHIPLRRILDQAPRRLASERAVVVYCYDHQ